MRLPVYSVFKSSFTSLIFLHHWSRCFPSHNLAHHHFCDGKILSAFLSKQSLNKTKFVWNSVFQSFCLAEIGKNEFNQKGKYKNMSRSLTILKVGFHPCPLLTHLFLINLHGKVFNCEEVQIKCLNHKLRVKQTKMSDKVINKNRWNKN